MKVVIFGAILLALGNALTPFAGSSAGLVLTMGILSASGAAAGSFSILIGIAAQRLPPEKRSFAAGVINAGGSISPYSRRWCNSSSARPGGRVRCTPLHSLRC